ncbi:MAG: cupin domain-containing protein [Spirochaetaceae bacterium]
MSLYVHEEDLERKQGAGHSSVKLIDDRHGAVNEYAIGVSFYESTEYGPPGKHPFQEGFYVVEGWGDATVGDEEFSIRPGTAFLAPKEALHSVRRAPDSPPVKIVWTHAASE